ncbi:SH3 domain-containing protein [Niabella ginsengisoli]|uniref:SH3 domain-containing protein n=1 Tax=Niabella ginsengisoli TaxID=522298 RepID=A0ABS9SIX9_9BACT|nr:SH3 domain-containing protein [Niabella ginsengisoli]
MAIGQQDDVVSVIKNINSEWTSIRTKDGTEGFIAAQFLQSGDQKATVKPARTAEVKTAKVYGTNINVRKGPSTEQDVVGIAQQDEVLTYVKKVDNEWSEIRMGDGTNGFIATRFLSLDGKPSLASVEAEKLAQSQAEDAKRIAEEAAASEKALAEATKKRRIKKLKHQFRKKLLPRILMNQVQLLSLTKQDILKPIMRS